MKRKRRKRAKWTPSPPIPEGSLLAKDTAREMLTKEAPELESEDDEKEPGIVAFFFYHDDNHNCAHAID